MWGLNSCWPVVKRGRRDRGLIGVFRGRLGSLNQPPRNNNSGFLKIVRNFKGEVWSVASAVNPPVSNFRSAGADRLAGLARLARRICVLRERGEGVAADQLEKNEFGNMVRDIRLAEGPDAVPESELRVVFATEERRVADAAVLAELLAPQLAAVVAKESRTAAHVHQPATASPYEIPTIFSRTPEPATAGSTAIPDLLDAMLAADGAARRQRGSRLAT